jgi:hypothetical protein
LKKVYVAHPYLGLPENRARVEGIIIGLMQAYKDTVFISPIHTFGFLYKVLTYEEGMKLCLELLKMCDELWLCPGWEQSRGCRIEKETAEQCGIPIRYLSKELTETRDASSSAA